MPQPTAGDVHVNAPLTNISVAYVQSQDVFVADKVFPIVGVEKQSDLYYLFNKGDFLRDEARPRAPGTESAGSGFRITTASYAALIEAFHKDVPDPIRANADSQLNLDRAVTEWVTQKMLIRRERRFVTSFFQTGVWTTDITPGTLWSAASGSTPLKDVEVGKLAIHKATGYRPNTLTMSPEVFSALRYNPDVREMFKYTSAESISLAMLARYFDIERVLVINGVYDTALETVAGTSTMAFMAGKHALLSYSAPSPNLMMPTAGYTFAWNGFLGAANGIRVKTFRLEQLESDRVEGEMAYDMKVVAPECGYFFNSVVA